MTQEIEKVFELLAQYTSASWHKCGISIGDINPSNLAGINAYANDLFISAFPLDLHFGLILKEGVLDIVSDYQEYHITEPALFSKGGRSIVSNLKFSDNAGGIFYFCTKDFIEECVLERSASIIKKVLTARPRQLLHLDNAELNRLSDMLERSREYIQDENKELKQELIFTSFFNYFLEVVRIIIKDTHIREAHEEAGENGKLPSASGKIMKSFISLLFEHGETEHNPSFYADKLCISVQYLSVILKGITRNSAKKWIEGYAVARAKLYLRQPQYSIQQIAAMMNFADQSSFGKFFKKNAGMSPKAYRNKNN